jgi:hypothetical protein
MKLRIVVEVFAFILFLFLPSIAVMLFAGFILKSSAWFIGLGLPVLLVNGLATFLKPMRGLIGSRLDTIARGH